MRVLLLSEISSVHTIKWANSLAEKEIEVMVFGLKPVNENLYHKNIKIESAQISEKLAARPKGSLAKIAYITALPRVKKLIAQFKPDILHSHYISSYGIIGALTGFHPFIVSVWGSDIFTFPKKSIYHKKLIKYILSKSDTILSTSKMMAERTSKYTDKNIEVTPFGIDTEMFYPFETKSIFLKEDLVIGTIKALEKQYGIEYLIRSFHLTKKNHPQIPLKLLIAGKGSLENELKKLTVDLGIQNDVVFTGKIPFSDVPKYHNMIDIFIALSVSDDESFGVAVIEASACGKPVIVSDAGGLPEVVKDGITGFIVPKNNPEITSENLVKLIQDEKLRKSLGNAGRERVKRLYEWNNCVNQMISIYQKITDK